VLVADLSEKCPVVPRRVICGLPPGPPIALFETIVTRRLPDAASAVSTAVILSWVQPLLPEVCEPGRGGGVQAAPVPLLPEEKTPLTNLSSGTAAVAVARVELVLMPLQSVRSPDE